MSVITPVRNGPAALVRCLLSVRQQIFPHWEHILIDDGSAEETRNLLGQFAAEDERIRLVVLDRSEGAARARNEGIAIARGRFIAFLDADDVWLPGKLAAQLDFMLENDVALSYGSYAIQRPGTRDLTAYHPPETLSYRDLLGGCPIGCLTVMYDRAKLGFRFFPVFRRGQDWALWLQLAREGAAMGRYPGLHAIYSKAGGSLSSNKVAKLRDVWRIYRQQEAQSVPRSLYKLSRHFLFVMNKRRKLASGRKRQSGTRLVAAPTEAEENT